MAAVTGGRGKLRRPVHELKAEVLKSIASGRTVEQAMTAVNRSPKTYEAWRNKDPDFKVQVERLRSAKRDSYLKRDEPEDGFPTFEDFSERYFNSRVFPHMQNVVDLIEGRDPGWTHPSMVYERGEPDLVMVNMPPDHAKSTTVTMNYVTYRIVKDPNIRVLIVSKTESMAKKFLFGIKERLTHPQYAQMHLKYGPPDGYASNSESWSQTMIYVSADARDAGEKDPTVQALGIQGHIYGARADLIVLDDCIVLSNANDYEKQIEWVQAEVMSRISASGALLVVGTRMAAKDMYLELLDPRRYPDEESPWTYLSMPAVLSYADDPQDWVTLWPKSNRPEIGAKGDMAEADADGLYPKWDGPRLAKKRSRTQPRMWAMVYMQQQVPEDAIFHPDAIKASINGNRLVGLMPKGMANCREQGMDGLVVVAGMDPAMKGFTAATVIGLDTRTQKRHVLDLHNEAAMTPDAIRALIKGWTDKYGIVEWRIEANAFQSMLTQDREVREFLSSRGAILREHTTGRNKWDSDFGVASLSSLWSGWQDGRQLIELPSTHRAEAMKSLIEQLVSWSPNAPKTQKTDMVMSLWFTEIACRERLQAIGNFTRTHANNPFATRGDKRGRSVINLYDADVDRLWRPFGGA